MGGYVSTMDQKAAKARSDEIDRQIEEDNRRFERECKVLLMGAGQSGISTIFRQMKIIHQGGLSEEELTAFRPMVYKNVMESAYQILNYMAKAGLNWVDSSNRALADKILDFHVKACGSAHPDFSFEIAEAIDQLWKDPIMNQVMDELDDQSDLMDSARYFFREVRRIGQPHYLPNETDVLRVRQKLVGNSEMRFTMGQLSIHMSHVGGQRSERKKWIHHFEDVRGIIFCTALSEYDQVLFEEKTRNRLAQSLILFESVINSRWFMRTSIFLFLSKIVVFKKKLPKIPLERYFPEYTGGTDVNKAAKYIMWKFLQANKARLSVYPHLIEATDTTNIRLVFAAVKETLLQNSLKHSGIL
ncbi:heterotrimeric G-protein alpha subunit, GPA3-like protein [Coprinopsis sp. MPI-PUGE-AT-0042]|nr:heterotrimeric G-protein alpha subunit, GPA3-like protein [Coprinopsis sp. MPI-PUGE-AT-0042]